MRRFKYNSAPKSVSVSIQHLPMFNGLSLHRNIIEFYPVPYPHVVPGPS
jgi:hypothetical protein